MALIPFMISPKALHTFVHNPINVSAAEVISNKTKLNKSKLSANLFIVKKSLLLIFCC